MTRKILTTHAFLKDLKNARKRGKPMAKLQKVIEEIANHHYLAKNFHPHRLTGGAHDCFECHIEYDWLLVYRINDTELELVRLGTHSDLFE